VHRRTDLGIRSRAGNPTAVGPRGPSDWVRSCTEAQNRGIETSIRGTCRRHWIRNPSIDVWSIGILGIPWMWCLRLLKSRITKPQSVGNNCQHNRGTRSTAGRSKARSHRRTDASGIDKSVFPWTKDRGIQ
jgi:hypothetical protein